MSINHYAFVRLDEEQTEALARGEPIKATATDDYGKSSIEFTINDQFGFLDEHAPDLAMLKITASPVCGERYVSRCNDHWSLQIVGARDVESIVPRYRIPTADEAAAVPYGARIRIELMRQGWRKSPTKRLLFDLFEHLRQDYVKGKGVA